MKVPFRTFWQPYLSHDIVIQNSGGEQGNQTLNLLQSNLFSKQFQAQPDLLSNWNYIHTKRIYLPEKLI